MTLTTSGERGADAPVFVQFMPGATGAGRHRIVMRVSVELGARPAPARTDRRAGLIDGAGTWAVFWVPRGVGFRRPTWT